MSGDRNAGTFHQTYIEFCENFSAITDPTANVTLEGFTCDPNSHLYVDLIRYGTSLVIEAKTAYVPKSQKSNLVISTQN